MISTLTVDEFPSFLDDALPMEQSAGEKERFPYPLSQEEGLKSDTALFRVLATWISGGPEEEAKDPHFERLLHRLKRLDVFPDEIFKEVWPSQSFSPRASSLLSRALAAKEIAGRPLLILPYSNGDDFRFLAHDLTTCLTYVIRPPRADDTSFRPLGHPRLIATVDALYCVQAGVGGPGGRNMLYRKWIFRSGGWNEVPQTGRYCRKQVKPDAYHPEIRYRPGHEKAPLTIVGFDTPTFLPHSRNHQFPIIQRSFIATDDNEGDEEDLSQGNDDGFRSSAMSYRILLIKRPHSPPFPISWYQ